MEDINYTFEEGKENTKPQGRPVTNSTNYKIRKENNFEKTMDNCILTR